MKKVNKDMLIGRWQSRPMENLNNSTNEYKVEIHSRGEDYLNVIKQGNPQVNQPTYGVISIDQIEDNDAILMLNNVAFATLVQFLGDDEIILDWYGSQQEENNSGERIRLCRIK